MERKRATMRGSLPIDGGRANSKTPRIFIALAVGDEVRRRLSTFVDGVRAGGSPGVGSFRWVAEHQYHITLKFLGEIARDKVESVCDGVEAAAVAFSSDGGGRRLGRLRLRAQTLGAFPDERRTRVLWVGVKGDERPLVDLQRRVDAQLRLRGFASDRRPFRPHITIARARHVRPLPEVFAPYMENMFGLWEVDRMQVIESELLPTGPRYTVLKEIFLRQA